MNPLQRLSLKIGHHKKLLCIIILACLECDVIVIKQRIHETVVRFVGFGCIFFCLQIQSIISDSCDNKLAS